MKETIIKELEGLNESALSELHNYIDYLKHKAQVVSSPLTPDNILEHFSHYNLLT